MVLTKIMNNSEIIAICQQLSREGKEPSVALIKARLSRPVAMPTVIGALKQWRATPDIKIEKASSEQEISSAPAQSLEQRVDALENEVKELKQIIAKLQAESE